jgi:hypothetical protein
VAYQPVLTRYSPSMWPQLSSPIERFFVFFYLYHLTYSSNYSI